jgi:hypothetical protein
MASTAVERAVAAAVEMLVSASASVAVVLDAAGVTGVAVFDHLLVGTLSAFDIFVHYV